MSTGPLSIDFSGCRVLVTGGSRGIAGEIARNFARNGATVAVNYCAAADEAAGFPDAAQHLVEEMRSYGSTAYAIDADLQQPGEGRRLVSDAAAHLGGIDILVLSASIQIHKDFLNMLEEDVTKQFQINLVSNIAILQETIPFMRERGWGRIITIGSVQESAPSAEMPIYAMTKAAQENLVRNLAVANAPYGITVNNVAPGLDQDRPQRLPPKGHGCLESADRPGEPDRARGPAGGYCTSGSVSCLGCGLVRHRRNTADHRRRAHSREEPDIPAAISRSVAAP